MTSSHRNTFTQSYLGLSELNFLDSFMNLVEMTMKNQVGRVLVNGDLSRDFVVDNGGKQGDRLFPLIYILPIEGFNAMIETSEDFKGLFAPDGLTQIIHIGCADDTCIPIQEDEMQIGS